MLEKIKDIFANLNDPLYKNSFYLMLTNLTGTGSGFFFWILAASFYTASQVGLAVGAISAIGLLSMFTRFGLEIGIIRYLPDSTNKSAMINSCLTVIIIASSITSIIFLLNLDFFSVQLSFLKQTLISSISFIIFVISFSTYVFQNNVFVGLRNPKYSLLQSIIALSRILALPILMSIGFLGIYLSYGFGFLLAILIGNFFISNSYNKYKFSFEKNNEILKEMFNFSFGNYVASILEVIPNYLLPLMVINLLGTEMNAYFYIAWSFTAVLLMIPRATATSLFAEGLYSGGTNLRKMSLNALLFIFILITPIILITIVLGDWILSLFGTNYSANAYSMLKILAISSIPFTFNVVYIAINRVQKKIIPVVIVYGFLSMSTLLGSFFLLQYVSLNGIAYSWIAANLMLNIYTIPYNLIEGKNITF